MVSRTVCAYRARSYGLMRLATFGTGDLTRLSNEMRAAGQLSDEEFEKARDAMITRLRSRSTDADDTTSETVNTDVDHADDASADSGADPSAGR